MSKSKLVGPSKEIVYKNSILSAREIDKLNIPTRDKLELAYQDGAEDFRIAIKNIILKFPSHDWQLKQADNLLPNDRDIFNHACNRYIAEFFEINNFAMIGFGPIEVAHKDDK